MANTTNQSTAGPTANMSSLFATLVIPIAFVISLLVFIFIMGSGSNFVDGDPNKAALPGNYLGIIHLGGSLVPILMTTLLTVITFTIERLLTLGKAKGKGNVAQFVKRVQYQLNKGDIAAANAECDKQKGSVANVIKAGLKKYQEVETQGGLSKDQALLAIQKEVEESTALELPMLEKNLAIIATIAPIGTLLGLLGTVLGMIKAFAAQAHAGQPDAVQLSQGISEALVNTAFGICTSAVAIIVYNYFTNNIDTLTYGIDEAGYSLQQNYAEKH
jgi:biopolymer transport protein ExbB